MGMQEEIQSLERSAGQVYYLSELVGADVVLLGKEKRKIGKLSDLIIEETGKFPRVTHLSVGRSFGYPSLIIPWDRVRMLTVREVVIKVNGQLDQYEKDPGEGTIFLKDYVLDKKVIDIEDHELEVVYDVKLVLRNLSLYIIEADVSRYGLLRRIGLGFINTFISRFRKDTGDLTISWIDIQPLPTHIGSLKGDVKLRVLKEKLSQLHPVDLADILEEMDHDQRVMIFNQLDTEQASDTLEEIDPHVQRALVASINRERIIQLIKEMTPGQAADLLSALPLSHTKDILPFLDPDDASKVRAILDLHEETVYNFTTDRYIGLSPELSVGEIENDYPRLAKGKDVIMYLYVVDASNRLRGVIDIKELLLADNESSLKDIMIKDVITLSPDDTLKQASQLFARYNFRALPVTDSDERITGVIPYRDVMNLTHHFVE